MPVVPVDSLVPPPTPAPGAPAVPPVAGSSGPVAGHAGAVSPAAAFPPAGGPTVNGPDAGGTASPSMTAVGGGEEARSADTPTRRPIVRIPSAVQGVRTVDSGTGELSAVQSVDEDLSHLETPRWRALHEGASPDQPESVGPVAAEGAGEPGFAAVGARPPTASTPAAAAARREPFGSVRPTPVEPEGRNDKLVRTIMFVLLGVVGVLVVLAVLWFVFLSKGDSSALEAVGPAWSILRL